MRSELHTLIRHSRPNELQGTAGQPTQNSIRSVCCAMQHLAQNIIHSTDAVLLQQAINSPMRRWHPVLHVTEVKTRSGPVKIMLLTKHPAGSSLLRQLPHHTSTTETCEIMVPFEPLGPG